MNPASIREPASFGKRREPNKIIVVRNGRERQITVNPVLFSAMAGMVFMFLFGYFAATAYLVFRDDLISSSYASQARLQHEYEDRIAALRSKLDRITSRQLLDQQAIETRVRELMERQHVIGTRGGSMREILEEARKRGLDTASATTSPSSTTTGSSNSSSIDPSTTGSVSPENGDQAFIRSGINLFSPHQTGGTQLAFVPTLQNQRGIELGENAFTRDLFGDVAEAIGIIDANQRKEVDAIRIAAAERTRKIGDVLDSIGVEVSASSQSDIGGPFEPLEPSVPFETHIAALEDALQAYDSVTAIAKTMPLGSPVPGSKVSSHYGSRVDPFNGKIAMHSGIDFKAKRGTPVKATGSGIVTKAGRKGGYGKVVVIRHANGYTTRYAHLSKILVKEGQSVTKGKTIGKVGSTGRSTGPHLHYEVRRTKKARNPSAYIKAGYKIRGLI